MYVIIQPQGRYFEMNDYAVSDIHGNAERLKTLLSILDKKHPNKDYVLHILGDLFDRGPDSEELISLIGSRYNNIHVIKGNHEDLFMKFMEYPKQEYCYWQMNYSNPTVLSFALKHMQVVEEVYGDKSASALKRSVERKYVDVSTRLHEQFREFYAEHSPQKYIHQIKTTCSMRDMQTAGELIKNAIKEYFAVYTNKERGYFEELVYLHMLEDFCNVYNYFEHLDKYSVVADKFLLVHSGFVTKNKDENIIDSMVESAYNPCNSVHDLPFQNERPLIWGRRRDRTTRRHIGPTERFDGKIIVYGHTTTDCINSDKSNRAVFHHNENGELVSIGLDGSNYSKDQGCLNCICLDDLSQIVIKGTRDLSSRHRLKVEHIPYSKHELQSQPE